MKKKYILLLFSILFYSCSSITLREGLNINEKEDWLQTGRNPEKTNISDSNIFLTPPFNELWKFNTDAAFDRNIFSVSDGVLFASCLNGDVYAIDIKNGSGIGKVNTKSKSSFSAPAIMKNIIIMAFSNGVKNFIAGYDFITGEFKWKKSMEKIISSPVIKDNMVFYCTAKGNIYKVDPETGNNLWLYKNKFPVHTSPSCLKNILLVGDVKGYLIALDIISGELIWNFKTEGGIYSDISVFNDKIFFGSDDYNFYCLDTAGVLVWKKNLNTKFLSSSTFIDKSVICSGINGKIYSLNISDGDIIWEYQTKGTISASPVLNKDKIFIGSYDGFFYCLDAKKGELLWKYELVERIRTTAVIWQKYIIVACDDKSIYCFK